MQIEIVPRQPGVGSVEADNVELAVLYPDSPFEAAGRSVGFGLDINHQAAHFTQKFAPDKIEGVILSVEIGVGHHHLGESQRLEVQGEDTRQFSESAASGSWVDKRNVLRTIAHIQTPEKVLVVNRGRVAAGIGFQVLKIGFDQWPQVAHLGKQEMLALHHAVDDLVKRARGWQAWSRGRGSGCRVGSGPRECNLSFLRRDWKDQTQEQPHRQPRPGYFTHTTFLSKRDERILERPGCAARSGSAAFYGA